MEISPVREAFNRVVFRVGRRRPHRPDESIERLLVGPDSSVRLTVYFLAAVIIRPGSSDLLDDFVVLLLPHNDSTPYVHNLHSVTILKDINEMASESGNRITSFICTYTYFRILSWLQGITSHSFCVSKNSPKSHYCSLYSNYFN